jgi:hypothetical protein
VINIELKGVNHVGSKGYFATSAEIANDPEMKALNVRATQFIARLGRAVNDGKYLQFLDRHSISFDSEKNKYVVDLSALDLKLRE